MLVNFMATTATNADVVCHAWQFGFVSQAPPPSASKLVHGTDFRVVCGRSAIPTGFVPVPVHLAAIHRDKIVKLLDAASEHGSWGHAQIAGCLQIGGSGYAGKINVARVGGDGSSCPAVRLARSAIPAGDVQECVDGENLLQVVVNVRSGQQAAAESPVCDCLCAYVWASAPSCYIGTWSQPDSAWSYDVAFDW